MTLQTDTEIKTLLEKAKTVAVVGYSNKPDRPSNGIARTLETAGYTVFLVNPTLKSTPEETIYGSLREITEKIDIVDVFRRPEDLPTVVDEAIAAKAGAVWMQLGIVNEDAARTAEEAGLQVVMDHCIKIEHHRLIGA